MGSAKPRKNTRAAKRRVTKTTERSRRSRHAIAARRLTSVSLSARRKRRDERLILKLYGVEAAAVIATEARSTDRHFQMHMERHVIHPVREVILTLAGGTVRWGKDNLPVPDRGES
jgi:hypothetical protein